MAEGSYSLQQAMANEFDKMIDQHKKNYKTLFEEKQSIAKKLSVSEETV
jgi:hypothetical protein